MTDCWNWPAAVALPIAALFTIIDFAFFSANLLKIADGGWIPLLAGALIFTIMIVWRRGVEALRSRLAAELPTPEQFLAEVKRDKIPRVPGTMVFLTRTGTRVPNLLSQHIRQFKSLPETVVTLTVWFEDVPRVSRHDRVKVECVEGELWHITIHFGFIEVPYLPAVRDQVREQGFTGDLSQAIYLGAHDQVVRSRSDPLLPAWQTAIFSFLYRNSLRMDDRFDLPRERFLAIGRHVAI